MEIQIIQKLAIKLRLILSRMDQLEELQEWGETHIQEAANIVAKRDQLEEQFCQVLSFDQDTPSVNRAEFTEFYNKFLDMSYVFEARIKPVSNFEFAVSSSQNALNDATQLDKGTEVENSAPTTQSNGRSSPDHQVGTQFSKVKLPVIDLPRFSDSPDLNWSSFRELFSALIIDDASLAPLRKMHYLRASLSGEPLRLISSLPLTTENFDVAWKTLESRYYDTRKLANNHWNAIADHPVVKRDSESLSEFVTTVVTNLNALRALNHPVDEWSLILTNVVLKKIDPQTRENFENANTRELPTVQDLLSFLEKRVKALKAAEFYQSGSKPQETKQTAKSHTNTQQSSSRYSLVTSAENNNCQQCKGHHKLECCTEFLKQQPKQRFLLVKSNKLCIICLNDRHRTPQCVSKVLCAICGKRHHQLLHFNSETGSPGHSASNKKGSDKSSVTSLAAEANSGPTEVLLGTALCRVRDCYGRLHIARALLDSGSQCTFITTEFAKTLNLATTSCSTVVKGLSNQRVSGPHYAVELELQPLRRDRPAYRVKATCLDSITGLLPSRIILSDTWDHIRHLELADPGFGQPQPIDLLIGADLYSSILIGSKIESRTGTPTAVSTTLGWVLSGPVAVKSQDDGTDNVAVVHAVSSFHSVTEETVLQFWELDKVPAKKYSRPEDDYCEKLFSTQHTRNEQGRYVVPLMFKEEEPVLGNSFRTALQRFFFLENKLKKNPSLHQSYVDFIEEYLKKGYIEPLESIPSVSYFFPHHGVIREESTTTKLRVVFDASCRTENKRSLNDTLYSGPKLQQDITTVLIRFRVGSIALTGDLERMFCQILLREEDRNYQCFLWRENPSQPIQIFRVNCVSFGVTCSPYLALRTVHQLASDEGSEHPKAASVLMNQIYVDDIVLSCDSVSDAKHLYSEMTSLLAKGCFRARKWMSNSAEVLECIPAEDRQVDSTLSFDQAKIVKILGLAWRAVDDSFTYRTRKGPQGNTMTKRGVLSELARIYDPLGLLAPAILPAKILFKQLWARNIDWDDPIPPDLAHNWEKFQREIRHFEELKIQRAFKKFGSHQDFVLNGFADASTEAYAAAVFLTTISGQSANSSQLIIARSRVTPSKRCHSIPRLELCGCVMLAQLVDYVKEVLDGYVNITSICCWTDSTVALHWIKSHPSKWQTFVANRVNLIQELTNPDWWNHVRSENNPADCATRGLSPAELVTMEQWWFGPSFLEEPSQNWPKFSPKYQPEIDSSLLEEKPVKCIALTSVSSSTVSKFIELSRKVSSWQKLLRIAAFCFRGITKSKDRPAGSITTSELERATLFLLKLLQENEFCAELNALKHAKAPSNRLCKLSPFIDEKGVLRVGGRLSAASLNYESRHPIVLPGKHPMTKLLVQFYHEEFGHPSAGALASMLSQRYWILRGRQLIRSVVFQCVQCYKCKPQLFSPKMADLPAFRVNQTRPFLKSGTDFAGPIMVRNSLLRRAQTTKAYICIFICLSTKAVHIEAVTSLSTPAFLAAFDRFTSRRGLCTDIYSDNGSNYIGADGELAEFLAQRETQEYISQKHAPKGIQWHWNPPSGPHFGGIWESAVKVAKTQLLKIIGKNILTFEELSTVLARVEAIMNSRPIAPMSPDPNDFKVLTPGHFLIHDVLAAPPEPDLTEVKLNQLQRWQLVTQIHQHFWRRWSQEYLPSLQSRVKWTKNKPTVKPGQMVILKDDTHPIHWKIGRVSDVYPGKDGIVRVVDLRVPQFEKNKVVTKILRRPVVKLAPLPHQE